MKFKSIAKAALTLPLFVIAAQTASAQTIQRSYPGHGCAAARSSDLFPDEATGPLEFALDMYRYNTNGSISAAVSPGLVIGSGSANDNNGIRVACPVQREKVGTNETAGAKFFAYFDRNGLGAISCTLSSTKAHNGVIVSSATRSIADGVGSDGLQTLTRSTAPANGFGPYNFSCSMDGSDNSGAFTNIPTSLYSYRIREF